MNIQNKHNSEEENEISVLKTTTLVEISLKYNLKVPSDKLPVVDNPYKAEKIFRQVWNLDTIQLKEEFIVLLLNNAKKCLGWSKISSGSSTSTIVDPSTIFQVALLANAKSVILAHNHPAGNVKPSESDRMLTYRIKELGELFGIQLVDHIILTAENYLSFKSENLIE